MDPRLRVDGRAGSIELLSELKRAGVAAEVATLPYGDVAFEGRGPGGRSVSVGIEFKTLPDVLACIADGRFSGHQLPGLLESYEVSYLMIEGIYRPGRDGSLWWNKGIDVWVPYAYGSWTYASIENWLSTITIKGGVHVKKTATRRESIASIVALYRWWTQHEFDEHRSHLAPHVLADGKRNKLSLFTRMLMAGVDGLGEKKAEAVATTFGSMDRLCHNSGALEAASPGIGPVLAKRISEVLHGG